jgi:microsomal epoxide hydrolase
MKAFHVDIAEEALTDVARRLTATRWLDDAHGEDPVYGASLSFARELSDHWLYRFDWRATEARINRFDNWRTEIDGLDLHFIHHRSQRADALPLLLLHGWPSSFLEFLNVIERLTAPKDEAPAFHVVVPSLPGYGFSGTRPGTSPRRIAGLLTDLMKRLGYDRFLVQGGNWGSTIGTAIARQWPERVIGLHLNSVNGSPPAEPIALSPADQAMADRYVTLLSAPHFNLLSQTPMSVAHALNDSPTGLAAWIGEKLWNWADTSWPDNPGLDLDWIVSSAALYWFTETSGTSAALYREAVNDPMPETFVTVRTAVAAFAEELVLIPRPWAERHYNLVQWSAFGRGGHFAAIEMPDAFVEDLRSFAELIVD